MEQPKLLEIPEQVEPAKPLVTASLAKVAPMPKWKPIDRKQQIFTVLDVEALIAADHKARAIWDLAGRLELSRFAEDVKTVQGEAGRAAWEPRLLVSLWVYAYSEGISSAREIERRMGYEPGFEWLSGMAVVNHHTLSDFRVKHKGALDELFVQLLGLLEKEGLLSLEQVMHDGTKIQAKASADTFRREKTVKEHLERARQVVASMGDPGQDEPENKRREAAQKRASREREAKLESVLKEMEQIREKKRGEKEKEEARVSMSEPEARMMKHANQGFHPSYNAQISTDAENKIIVGMQLNQCASDSPALLEAMEQVEQNVGAKPEQVVVDGGYTSRENIVGVAEKGSELIGPVADQGGRKAAALKAAGIDAAFGAQAFVKIEEGNRLQCAAGNLLAYVRQSQKRGCEYRQYQASGSDCLACRFQLQCCPKNGAQGRTVSILVEKAEVIAFKARMEQPEAKQIYKRRGEVAEFPNAWIKDKLGVRKFRVFGLAKAATEMMWAGLTYNVMQWVRLIWRKPVELAAVA